MTPRDRTNPELLDLIDAWCDGAIDSAQTARLCDILASDRAARLDFLAYADIHGQLAMPALRGAAAVWGQESGVRSQESSRHTPCAVTVPAQASVVSSQWSVGEGIASLSPQLTTDHGQLTFSSSSIPHSTIRNPQSFFSSLTHQPRLFSVAAATVVMVTALFAAAQLRFGAAASETAEQRNIKPSAPVFVAQLTRERDCRWANEFDAPMVGAHLQQGQSLQLRSGVVEVAFRSGAVATVEGPATLVVAGKNRGRLALGRLVARIEKKQAVGFTVETPTAKVVDLGTEFGIYVDDQGATEAYVFEGKIKTVCLKPTPENEKTASAVLGQGEAIRVPAGGNKLVRDDDANGERFAFRSLLPNRRSSPDTGETPVPPLVVLLADDFERNQLDPAKWTTDLSSQAGGEPSILVRGGQVEIRDRAYLNTADDFDPAAYNTGKYAGGIKITGRWTFTDPLDFFMIATRSGGKPNNDNIGEVDHGVAFQAFVNGEGGRDMRIDIRSDSNATLTQKGTPIASNVLDFEITDDGRNVSFKLTEVGGEGRSFALDAATPFVNPHGRNKITFYNREKTELASCLDNVLVRSRISEPVIE